MNGEDIMHEIFTNSDSEDEFWGFTVEEIPNKQNDQKNGSRNLAQTSINDAIKVVISGYFFISYSLTQKKNFLGFFRGRK
jgi:hypothetical protein